MKTEEYVAANREAWDEAAPLHRRQNHTRLVNAFREPGYSCLMDVEREVFEKIGVTGKSVAQLCCNNGRELVSVKNLGAGRCVGFDQAPGFIEQAKELNEAASTDCAFECANVYEIPAAFDQSFDLLFITIGVLSWMPDLPGFMQVVARLLKPGGQFFISEEHPIMGMHEPGKADEPVLWNYSYFSKEPFVESDGLDYYGGGTYKASPNYSFQHKLSDIFTCAIEAGMGRIEHFREHPDHISNTFWNVEKQGPELPMSYTLVFRKS